MIEIFYNKDQLAEIKNKDHRSMQMISEIQSKIDWLNRELNRYNKKASGRVFVPLNNLSQTFMDLRDLENELYDLEQFFDFLEKTRKDTNVRKGVIPKDQITKKAFKVTHTIVLKDFTKQMHRVLKTEINKAPSFSDKQYVAFFYTSSGDWRD